MFHFLIWIHFSASCFYRSCLKIGKWSINSCFVGPNPYTTYYGFEMLIMQHKICCLIRFNENNNILWFSFKNVVLVYNKDGCPLTPKDYNRKCWSGVDQEYIVAKLLYICSCASVILSETYPSVITTVTVSSDR